jgi:hypothetical protein
MAERKKVVVKAKPLQKKDKTKSTDRDEQQQLHFYLVDKHSDECSQLLHKRFFEEKLPDRDKAQLGVVCMALTSVKYITAVAGFIQDVEYEESFGIVINHFLEHLQKMSISYLEGVKEKNKSVVN